MVLQAGQRARGRACSSHAFSFRGPQVGCSFRSATISSTVACGVASRCRWGARERSARPANPSRRYRSSHLYPTRRLTPYRAQTSVIESQPSRASNTNRIRSSIGQVSLHGIEHLVAVGALGCVECYLCARIILLPLCPVRTAYSPRVRILPPPPPGPEAIFNNCPLEGNAAREDTQAQNRLKNRTTAPQASDINPAITLQAGSEAGGLEVRAPLGGCARRASLQGRKVQAGLAALGRLRRSNYAD